MNSNTISKSIVVIALLAILGGSALWFKSFFAASDSQASDLVEVIESVPVQAANVRRVTLHPSLELVGTVMAIPEHTAMVSPQLGGWVVKLDAVEGQAIQAGQPLVHLDDRTAHTDIERAAAVVAEKEAALKRLKRGYLPQELEVAKQDRDKAKATANGLQSELVAMEDLRKRGEISPVQYESKQKAVQSAEAALASADAHLKLLQEGTPTEMVEEAQAFLEAAKADLEHAKLTLEWCTINSPIDGVVVQLLAHQGQFFDRAVPLATVMDLSKVFVQLRIPNKDFGKVTEGTKVEINLTSIPDRTFEGTVTRISGQADPLTGNVNMFALVDNQGGQLRPGLICEARVWLPEIPDALAVPVAAIGDNAGTTVVTLIQDGKTQEAEIEVGVETNQLVQVTQGLSEGDQVAIAGGYGLPDGCAVQIVDDLADPNKTSQSAKE